jgi:hypothetical protein
MKYTQREWDRIVGYGKVPDEYSYDRKEYEDKRAQKIVDNKGYNPEAEEIPQKPMKTHDSPK